MVHKYNPCPLLFPAASDLKVRAHPWADDPSSGGKHRLYPVENVVADGEKLFICGYPSSCHRSIRKRWRCLPSHHPLACR